MGELGMIVLMINVSCDVYIGYSSNVQGCKASVLMKTSESTCTVEEDIFVCRPCGILFMIL